MTRRETERTRQLRRMYDRDDGRLAGGPGWEKLPFFWFLLFLSYRCTRRCGYCYTFNQVGDGNVEEMDEETFARLLDWIPEVWEANNVRVNAVGFLGGEPLLRTDRIRRVMDAVYRKTDGMQGFVYTNADTVDEVNWDDLEEIQWISTNITEIGFAELERRMAIIGERSNVIGQTVVATLDETNLARAAEIARFGMEHGYRLRFYRNLYRGADAGYKVRLLRAYHAICDMLEGYAARGHEVHTTFLIDTLIPMWDDHEVSPYHCGRRVATVFPDGGIGPCIRNHSLKTGTIFDADPMARIQSEAHHYDFRKSDLPGKCRTCASRTVCQGGCPNDKLVHAGTASCESLMCEIHQEIIPRLRQLESVSRKSRKEETRTVGAVP